LDAALGTFGVFALGTFCVLSLCSFCILRRHFTLIVLPDTKLAEQSRSFFSASYLHYHCMVFQLDAAHVHVTTDESSWIHTTYEYQNGLDSRSAIYSREW
jgi:hypothetical protein